MRCGSAMADELDALIAEKDLRIAELEAALRIAASHLRRMEREHKGDLLFDEALAAADAALKAER